MKWLHEPLVHFLALGAGLFLLFALVGGSDEGRTDRVLVSAAQVELLGEGFARTWQRPPSPQDLVQLVDDYVRDEIYYREAIAMGLDRDDPILRRRMRQKLEFFTEDVMSIGDPSDRDLEVYLEEHADEFRVPAVLSLDQIYLNPDRRGESLDDDAARILARLRGGGAGSDWAALGDTIMLPVVLDGVSETDLEKQFGSRFSERLVDVPVGSWEGPIESGYGLHLVRIRQRTETRNPPLEEVRAAVEREWRADRRANAEEAFYEGLRERYSVEVEWAVDELGAEAGRGSEGQ
jgi:hypothetical protein